MTVFLSYHILPPKKKIENGKLVCLDVKDFETNIQKQLIHRKNKWISNSLHAFLKYVKEHEF